ncbi:MAG TPA: alkaline phosphatase family protein [Vicinamibacteria bacterium]|nr:alkaline phosphatase family protein [Vicinamibacteria bacterium]
MRRALALALLFAAGCSREPASEKRLIVLGFDGMDHALTKELMEAGRLPNFSRLAEAGSFQALETSVPPQSPVAWSNFITGMDSGGHGIFDFLHRDPETMVPYLSTTDVSGGGTTIEVGGYQFPLSGGSIELLRKGRTFWEVLENHGVETTIIRMPANFPPSGTATRELTGMGTPDLPGTIGTFSFYTSKLFAFAGQDISGGEVYEVDIFDNVVEAALYGPDNPFLVETEKVTSPFTVYLDPVDPVAKIVAGAEELILREGEWSEWVTVEFPLIPTQTLAGMVRFYLRSVRPDFELYASPVNFDPMAPPLPISTPGGYAAELARATGRFYTQGMPEDTKAIEQGVLTTEEFLAQAEIAGREIREQYRYVLDRFQTGLLFYYVGNVDQVSHVMWKVREPDHPEYDPEVDPEYEGLIEDLYVGLDEMVGYTLDHMGEDTTLVVMSDHGFTSFRRSFHLNAWLAHKGYLAVKNPDLENDPGLFVNVDWTGTRAYGVGLNALYVNLRGREKNGIVAPEKREALMDEIAEQLLGEIDPATGLPAVTKMYKREEVYRDRGELEIGPDLIVGYAKGTRGSGRSALGAVGKEIITDNLDEWSGDHEMDHETVPGVLLTSRPLKRPASSLKELGRSILVEFGIDEPIQPTEETE